MSPDLLARVAIAAEGLAQPLQKARSLHPTLYTSEDVYKAEMTELFEPGWLSVARSTEIPRPGDWRVVEIMNRKVLLTRGRDGVARAMSPVCRHKWALVAEGCGHSTTLVCPYHRWTYDLTGHLRGAPHLDVASLAPEQTRLPAYGCEEWLGWIFVNLDGRAEPLAPQLRAVEEVAGPWRVAELVPMFEPLRFKGGYNWKTLCDNVGESYHIMGTHPQSVLPYSHMEGSRWWTDGRRWCRSDAPTKKRRKEGFFGPSLSSSVAEFSGTWTYNVYPCHIFGLAEDFVVWQRLDVRGAGEIVMDLMVLGAPETREHPGWAEVEDSLRDSVQQIEDEDQRAFKLSYEGQLQPGAEPGSFAGYEEGTWHFQNWWAQTLLARLRGGALNHMSVTAAAE